MKKMSASRRVGVARQIGVLISGGHFSNKLKKNVDKKVQTSQLKKYVLDLINDCLNCEIEL